MAILKQKVNGVWITIPLVNKITVDSAISDISENPVQNKVIKEQIDNLQNYASERIYIGSEVPTDTNKLWIDPGDNSSSGGTGSGSGGSSTTTDALSLAGGTMQGAINMNGNKITNLIAPTADSDAATKSYVDNLVSSSGGSGSGGGTSGGLTQVFHAGTTAPTNTNLLWIDTNSTTGGLKYYNGTSWIHIPVAYT